MKRLNRLTRIILWTGICCLSLWLWLLPLPVGAVTIADPFHGTDEYSVTGTGTAADPYVIGLTGINNRITHVGLDAMAAQAPEAIWLVEHRVDDKIDYTLRFSTAIVKVVKAPLMLDVIAWQKEEGILHLEVGEKDSLYMPATLVLDVSGYPEFADGKVVTVRGKTTLRTRIENGCLRFALENGGDHIMTVAGYQEPLEDIISATAPDSSGQTWDDPNDTGEAVAREYTRAGTAELPFNVDLSETKSSVVKGEVFEELKNSGQSRSFAWKDENGTLLWSYLAEGARMSVVPAAAEFDLAISTSLNSAGAVDAAFAHRGNFPGKLSASIYVGDYFSNASIVAIKGEDVATAAVVDRGYITFRVERGGVYTVSDTGETVASASVPDAKAVSEETRDNIYTRFKYRGQGYGTADEPLTLLGKLDTTFHASWKSMNTIAGYAATFNPAESSYDSSKVMKAMVEYRSPVTGKLIASLYIDGSQWRMTPESMKGPYYLDYKLNPNEATITAALEAHSLYTGKYAPRKEAALETLLHCLRSEEYVLFFMSRTRDFAGVINYKIDVSRYFQPGDLVSVNYILGSCNGDLYHGEAPNHAELLLEESSYSKYDLQTVVDASGYISFPLYTGGFFTFSKTGVTAEKEDSWYAGNEGQGPGDGTAAGNKKEQLVSVEELVEESVADSTHTETGTLVRMGDADNLKEVNFTGRSADGNVQVSGHLRNPEVALEITEETEKLTNGAFNLPEDRKALVGYNITLKKPSGFTYHMDEDDYLDVTICLGPDYSVYEQELLFVKCTDDKGRLTNQVFSSHGELAGDGKMYFTFRTPQLGSFVVLQAADADELTAAIALKQEYTAEATTALAEQSLRKEDENKTMKFILLATLTGLAVPVIVTDIRRRRVKSGVATW
ncbi:hypothetical protein ABDB91_15245 [Desulfoscipio sp. XC116]|uniref:hypothetical protein n=1 Tax=Desulfoscipio sp. XC116 TaxID=3144975 RepID=UPI00325B27ED